MPGWRVLLLAVACALSVANVYYAQPLLDAMGREFGLDEAAVGMVVTATQIGCAVALLLVVPLGDLLDRRRLMIGQLVLLMLALAAVATASGPAGCWRAWPRWDCWARPWRRVCWRCRRRWPRPASAAAWSARPRAVVIGLLLARTLSGALADLWGWRAVYLMSAALSALLAVALALGLPRRRLPSAGMGYGALLRSMYTLVLTEPVLRVRGMIALLMFAAVSVFWTALVLPLSAPPHALSHTAIGAFGLVGVAGVLMAARAGRLADGGQGQRTTGAGLVLLCLSWIPLALLDWSLWALALGVLLLDVALQALHVTNQAMIFSIGAQAHSRLVGAYMLFYAAGSGLGAIAATTVYAHAGWPGVCALGAGFSAAALLFWLATLPRGVAAKPREGQCQNAAG